MRWFWFFHRVALPPLLLTAACAHVKETRTQHVVDEESVRLSETPRPDLSRPRVRATLTARELGLTVSADARCLVQFAERKTSREHIRRVPSQKMLGAEAAIMAVSFAIWISARRSSSGGRIDGGDVLGALALGGGLGSGAALAIDASSYSDTRTERTETSPDGMPRVAPCKSNGPRPSRVELTSTLGRRFTVPLDGFGRGRLLLPDDVWVDDRVDFDVNVDGVVLQRLVLTRPP